MYAVSVLYKPVELFVRVANTREIEVHPSRFTIWISPHNVQRGQLEKFNKTFNDTQSNPAS